MRNAHLRSGLSIFCLVAAVSGWATTRKVIVDEDVAAPSDSNIHAISMLLTQPQVELVGVTTVIGDGDLDVATREVGNLLEAVNRRDIPVVPGAVRPLVRTAREMAVWEDRFGKLSWKGAWNKVPSSVAEKAATGQTGEPAAAYLVRQARTHPGEITLIALGPLTNIALACALDPHFAGNIRELVVAAGTFDQKTDALVGSNFNNYFDPEASRVVYRAFWRKLTVISPESMSNVKITPAMEKAITDAGTPLTRHLKRSPNPSRDYPMWDEICVALWLDPSLAGKQLDGYLDVELGQGAGYGNVVVWSPGRQPGYGEPQVRITVGIEQERYEKFFVKAITGPITRMLSAETPLSR